MKNYGDGSVKILIIKCLGGLQVANTQARSEDWGRTIDDIEYFVDQTNQQNDA